MTRLAACLVMFVGTGALTCTALARSQVTANIDRSDEAVTLIRTVLNASGFDQSNDNLRDLVATGTLTSPTDGMQTAITIMVRQRDQIRIDSSLPTGKSSVFYNHGRSASRDQNGSVVPQGNYEAASDANYFFPLKHLAAALNDTSYSLKILDPEVDPQSGHSLYHLRLQRVRTNATESGAHAVASTVFEYFIDSTDQSIVRLQRLREVHATTPFNTSKGPFEIYRFSAYQNETGVSLPHQISVWLDDRLISKLQISDYKINTGLTDGIFTPTPTQ